MAANIIYCAPVPFNIVFHNANKGKMRINVLDLSRFCCRAAPGRENRRLASSCPTSPPLGRPPFARPIRRHAASGCATSRASTQGVETTPGIFFPLACSRRIFLRKVFFHLPPHPRAPRSASRAPPDARYLAFSERYRNDLPSINNRDDCCVAAFRKSSESFMRAIAEEEVRLLWGSLRGIAGFVSVV